PFAQSSSPSFHRSAFFNAASAASRLRGNFTSKYIRSFSACSAVYNLTRPAPPFCLYGTPVNCTDSRHCPIGGSAYTDVSDHVSGTLGSRHYDSRERNGLS